MDLFQKSIDMEAPSVREGSHILSALLSPEGVVGLSAEQQEASAVVLIGQDSGFPVFSPAITPGAVDLTRFEPAKINPDRHEGAGTGINPLCKLLAEPLVAGDR